MNPGPDIPKSITEDVSQLVDGCNQFACDLYSRLAASSDGDLFFSPSSVSAALAMTLAGAGGQTAREMIQALRFPLPDERLHEAFRHLQAGVETGGVELRIANRLWAQRGYHFLGDFLDTTGNCYGATLADVDFVARAELVRQQINGWVEEQTAGKITDLIQPGVLNELTRLVLTNAIYFWGSWEQAFETRATREAPFWTALDQSVNVPMMHHSSDFAYGEFPGLQVIELPYQSQAASATPSHERAGGFVMWVLLPRQTDGLQAVEGQLTPAKLKEWTALRRTQVDLSLPRFRVEASFHLNEKLQELGMRQAFSMDDADFSKMTDDPPGLYIEAVLHKAFVDVNEEGTEAAAATAVVMFLRGGAPRPPKEFRADHPFVFLIADRRTGLIHFMGRATRL